MVGVDTAAAVFFRWIDAINKQQERIYLDFLRLNLVENYEHFFHA